MREIMEYAILGTIAIIILLAFSPSLVGFLDDAVSSVTNSSALSSSEQDLITGVMILVVLAFFALAVYVVYAAIESKYL